MVNVFPYSSIYVLVSFTRLSHDGSCHLLFLVLDSLVFFHKNICLYPSWCEKWYLGTISSDPCFMSIIMQQNMSRNGPLLCYLLLKKSYWHWSILMFSSLFVAPDLPLFAASISLACTFNEVWHRAQFHLWYLWIFCLEVHYAYDIFITNKEPPFS